MDEKDLQNAEQNAEQKSVRREKKKRKRMHVGGKSVFELQRLLARPRKRNTS